MFRIFHASLVQQNKMFNNFDVIFVFKKFFFRPIYYSLDPDPH